MTRQPLVWEQRQLLGMYPDSPAQPPSKHQPLQELLKTASGRRELENWPQYRGHIRPDSSGRTQVYLNVFEYFLFWNAFYVLRGGRGLAPDNGRAGERGLAGGLQAPRSYMSDIRRMGTSFISGGFILATHGTCNYAMDSPSLRCTRISMHNRLRPGCLCMLFVPTA